MEREREGARRRERERKRGRKTSEKLEKASRERERRAKEEAPGLLTIAQEAEREQATLQSKVTRFKASQTFVAAR